MNDLFSHSFKRYQDIKSQGPTDDLEAGGGAAAARTGRQPRQILRGRGERQKDMADVEKLYKRLQESNEECKIVHNAKTMKELRARMDSDVSQVLKRVKIIKNKLEALDKSTPHTATSRAAGRAPPQTGPEQGDPGAGEGQILDALSEIQERHDAVKEIEKNLVELHQIFLDMAALVEAQGQQLNDIESHVAHASSFVRRGTEQLQEAREYQKVKEVDVYCYSAWDSADPFDYFSDLVIRDLDWDFHIKDKGTSIEDDDSF
ncbi:hypothetical protein DH2020_022855 [Rehmannia glutinosa]|uniref:t-SNARE coiled-coil homology domain-containing protein n=1 Tax=Rehmannia glutinosa TaxID=99300 RepID=A0ABR0W583_REHGL